MTFATLILGLIRRGKFRRDKTNKAPMEFSSQYEYQHTIVCYVDETNSKGRYTSRLEHVLSIKMLKPLANEFLFALNTLINCDISDLNVVTNIAL